MANQTSPTRLSPAELRRRLLAPPTDTSLPSVLPEDAPQPPSRLLPRRDPNRASTGTQQVIDLDALAMEMAVAAVNAKQTPLPEARLDVSQYGVPGLPPGFSPVNDESLMLRAQNAELTRIVEEMKPLLEEASQQENRQTELQKQVGEKDKLIEELTVKVQLLEEQIAAIPPPKVPKTRDELEEWSDELEKDNAKLTQERRRLDTDRQQLREDEESLEKQMRDMECSMARERAIMARQETELKRLSTEIQHELELLQRGDGTLREQLAKFQRRHQEVLNRTLGGTSSAPPQPTQAAPPPMAEPVPPTAPKKDSGLFGRIFRGGKSQA